jgi:rod shape-determining protein MreC
VNERRTVWVLIVVLAVQLALLATQGAASGTTRLEALGLRLLGPVARLVSVIPDSLAEAREAIKLRSTLEADNARLRAEVERLRLELLHRSDVEGDLSRLGAALRYINPPAGRIRAVDVVYVDHASWLRTLVLYTGDAPARRNQPVLAPEGLVGRVVAVAGPYAKVQLVTDRAAGVGAVLQRTRRQGVVRGSGSGTLALDYVPLQADARPGDRVLTAGIDGVYPRGIPIGTVLSVRGGGQLFHQIEVVPAVDLGTLDQVYLLDYREVPPALKEASPLGRP